LIPNVEKRVVLFESANVYLEEKKMEQYHARKQVQFVKVYMKLRFG